MITLDLMYSQALVHTDLVLELEIVINGNAAKHIKKRT